MKIKKIIFCLLLFIGLLISSQNVKATEPTGVSNKVTINILDNDEALFVSIKSLEIQDKEILGQFWGTREPIHENIIPESIVLSSNKGDLNYSLGHNLINIFVNGRYISFGKDDPLRITLQYKIKEFLNYDKERQLYYIFQPFHQYDISTIPKYYHLNVKIIFPFDLYPTSGPSYMPFLCFPTEELAYHEKFSITLLQETPPILQYNKSLYEEDENLFIENYFDLIPAPPKMQIEITEVLDLDTSKYKTKTKATNFYSYELCYVLTKDKNNYSIEIKDCEINSDMIKIPNFYHLKPNETSSEFLDNGYANKKLCSNSIIEFFYPFECFTISKNVPIKTIFYPEKLQKDFNVHYLLDMESSKGFIPINNKSFDLRLLPEIMTSPNIPGFGCQIFKPLDYPYFEIKDFGHYSAELNTVIFQPTIRSMLSYKISIVRSSIRIWLPLVSAVLFPFIAYLVRKYKRLNEKSHYITLYTIVFIPLFTLCLALGATPEDFFQLKSLPLILMTISILIILFTEFKKRKSRKKKKKK